MAQRMPRHSFDVRLPASVFETGIEIDERFSCFLVVEDKLVLPSQSPRNTLQDTKCASSKLVKDVPRCFPVRAKESKC